ncbi:MAG: hypothetical protein J7L54_02905, partial [Elusimicrobia bacterium]|nr:hypothetical protein [Elusimicrobiota bacterium]
DSDNAAATDDKISDTQSRLLVELEIPLSDGVKGNLLLSKNNRMYGQAQEAVAGWGSALNRVLVENAYISIKDFAGIFDLILGRQFFGEKDRLAPYIGPTPDDFVTVNAADGLKEDTKIGLVDVSLVSFKLWETGFTPSTDIDLSGLEAKSDEILDGLNLCAYAYQQVDKSVGGGGMLNRDDARIYGVKANVEIPAVDGLKAKAEYAMNAGTNNNADTKYTGNGMIIGASYNGLELAGSIEVSAEYANGTGNDATSTDNEAFAPIASDLRYGEIWANSLGNTGITDLTVMKIGASYKPSFSDKLLANLDYLTFAENEVASGSDKLGSEIDLKISCQQSENVTLEIVIGQFSPDKGANNANCDYQINATGDDSITKLAANLKVSF